MKFKKVQKIVTPDMPVVNTLFVITSDDKEWFVPIVAGNSMYDEIKKQDALLEAAGRGENIDQNALKSANEKYHPSVGDVPFAF